MKPSLTVGLLPRLPNHPAPLFMPVSSNQIVRSVKSLYQEIVLPVAAFQGEPSRIYRTIFRVESFA
jgi:hypothetical protein